MRHDRFEIEPRRKRRVGLTLALSALIIVAVGSFGGVGYAASNKPSSAAAAQYNQFTPKTVGKAGGVTTAQGQKPAQAPAQKIAPKAAAGQLPFTGLALWIPLAAGLVLIALGIVLRTRGRRRGSAAS
jgi:hypothetical protein